VSRRKDVTVLRDLARRYADACAKEVYGERRRLWRDHNSLVRTRPLIYCRWFACQCELTEPQLQCRDPFFRAHERTLRRFLVHDWIEDDFVLEPWLTQSATRITPPDGLWGVKIARSDRTETRGSWAFDPPLKKPDDIEKLVPPYHRIDEEATERDVSRLHDAIGDLLEINIDRGPAWQGWRADISTDLAGLRGLEQLMWDMTERPEWLHRLLAFMRDGILAAQQQAEDAGHWHLANHENQAVPCARELPAPKANGESVPRDRLWIFCASQETTQVSPAMFDEFMLQYQIPIIERFGLAAYGCCEDLTRKIDRLRRIPNLRRIAVTPWADVAACAEQIRDDYVLSWRPSPAEHVCSGLDPDHVRSSVADALRAARGCHVDITLKDVETVGGDPHRLRDWVRIVRDTCDRHA
jgi:hypothetical protein